jgi:hypothetical protein
MISVLRPEAKLFGLRCLMIIGTEGNAAASYKWRINAVKKALPKITSRLEMEVASGND